MNAVFIIDIGGRDTGVFSVFEAQLLGIKFATKCNIRYASVTITAMVSAIAFKNGEALKQMPEMPMRS